MARRVWIAFARIADIGAGALAEARQRLTPVERRRCMRIVSPRRRREFLAARWLAAASRRAWRYKGAAGTSLSHSNGWVACALLARGAPGVDVEPMLERDFARLGRWAFPHEPWDLPEAELRRTFYARWTRYEARLKCAGGAARAERTWLVDGVALSACLPWRAALQAGAPWRWRRRGVFTKVLRG